MNALIRQTKKVPRPPLPILIFFKTVVCIMPVAQIAIGAVYLEECPRERHIPIYLVVLGVFSLVLAILSCLPCTEKSTDGATNRLQHLCISWNTLVSCFIGCWFIAGNVWIYKIYQPNYVKNETMIGTYCDKTLYLFAFWTTTLVYILLGAFLVGGFLVLVGFYLCGRADADD